METKVETTSGPIVGFVDTQQIREKQSAGQGPCSPIKKWLGVPYGEAKRWEQSTRPAQWTNVKECHEYGSNCPQPASVLQVLFLQIPGFFNRSHIGMDENCFTLNIFAPMKAAKLPVLVYLHGGAWKNGSASASLYDGTNLIRQTGGKFILVTVNYRTNIFGFLSSNKSSLRGNYGLRDQRLALEWIQDNIDRFGGDPSEVTLFGQSAGAISIGYHIAGGKKLFKRAYLQSGTALTLQMESATWHDELLEKICKHVNVDSLEALRKMPAADLVRAGEELDIQWASAVESGEGAIWDIPPDLAAIERPTFVQDVWLASSRDEGTIFAKMLEMKVQAGNAREKLLSRFPQPIRQSIEQLYPDGGSGLTDSLVAKCICDMSFNAPILFLAENLCRKGVPVRLTSIELIPPALEGSGLGYFHSSELFFLFALDILWEEGSREDKASRRLTQQLLEFATGTSTLPYYDQGKISTFAMDRERVEDALWLSPEKRNLWFMVIQGKSGIKAELAPLKDNVS